MSKKKKKVTAQDCFWALLGINGELSAIIHYVRENRKHLDVDKLLAMLHECRNSVRQNESRFDTTVKDKEYKKRSGRVDQEIHELKKNGNWV